jgi:cyanate permease
VSRILSAVLVQMKGLGSLFHSLIQMRMSRWRSMTLRWALRRSLRLVSWANQRSTRLSRELLVGVKCRWNRGWRRSHFLTSGVLWVA